MLQVSTLLIAPKDKFVGMTQSRTQHKHALGAWIKESYADGLIRSIADAIVYCCDHFPGFNLKKPRSQRAWVVRTIRSLEIEELVKLNKPLKRQSMVELEREVSEILIHMHNTYPPPFSPSMAKLSPSSDPILSNESPYSSCFVLPPLKHLSTRID
ncbi:hypothetical protein THRCLA_22447 [Thraustotheca clavata]|uniref:Uncharacterized protein n=1 Tax=Thraustotheca clavata TaxID=74557 RepID=A0A1V9Z0T5_9STRA|nr:hypothetical protein THRCLA_22447 [Thraustotheca clavata]